MFSVQYFNVDIGVGDIIVSHAEERTISWEFFLKTIKENTLGFSLVITEIRIFLEPVFDAMVNEEEWQKQWSFHIKWTEKE